ncbi:MAG TPA: AAA family ATPase, partial [Candidatus Kapabacteria bacterium]|nr:AAA family ATPase [Candidatus Kapabacteria bacterium]
MAKQFNVTGVCIPEKHYMVDISAKTAKIFEMIERGDYFVINRPRQYGKTTTIDMLDRLLKTSIDYFPIEISFEGIGSDSFKAENVFIKAFLLRLKHLFKTSGNEDPVNLLITGPAPDSFSELGFWLNEFVVKIGKKPVLMIDEVDKSSNNQLFLDFLGLLREKYLNRSKEGEFTFHSVILVGVHDVKSLKTKMRKDSEAKYNSPWNIAVDFEVDLSFSAVEIRSMLADYA